MGEVLQFNGYEKNTKYIIYSNLFFGSLKYYTDEQVKFNI